MDDRAKDLTKRGDALFGKRGSWLSLLQEIAENFYPERADFTRQIYLGEEFCRNLTSSYPLIVRRELGNAISAMLRPRELPWFAITTDKADQLDKAGKAWLQWASTVMRRAMYDRVTQFSRATKEADNDFAAFGQAVITKEMDYQEKALLYRCWHLRDTVWAEKYNGTIGEVHRKWQPTVIQLCRQFPKTVPEKVKNRLEKEPYSTVECRHSVLTGDDYDMPSRQGKRRFPWASVYTCLEDQTILEETPSHSMIYTIPRWQTVSGSQYSYSPATVAGLPDARLIQAMTLTLLEAGEMAVRPPMIATKNAIRSDVNVFAGGITWVDNEYDERLGEVLRPITQDKSGLPFGKEIHAETREALAAAFYLNKLNLPAPSREMTAYETGQRIQEYIRAALPLFEPLETEYNASLCEDTFWEMFRNNMFGPPHSVPRSIQGSDIQFTFESPLHQAIEKQKGQTFLQGGQLIAQAVQLDPSSAYVVDAVTALRDTLEGIGMPAKWIRDPQEAQQIIDQHNQDAQDNQAMAQAGQGADVAQKVALAQQALTGSAGAAA